MRPHRSLELGTLLGCFALLGCVPPPPVSGIPPKAAADLREPIPSNAKFALRIPQGAEGATAITAAGQWAKFEKGLFAGGLVMVDQGLLEELLKSNPSPSYQQIRERTGADVLIDVGNSSMEFHRIDSGGYPTATYCEVITASAKVVDVARGTMLGTVEVTSSSCPEEVYQRTDPYANIAGATAGQLWWCGAGRPADHYPECPEADNVPTQIYLVDGEPRGWASAGKAMAGSLRERMTAEAVAPGSPLPADTPVASHAPPAAEPPPAASPPAGPAPAAGAQSLEARLAKLKDMLDKGVVTRAEHDGMRKKILSEY